MNPIPRFWLVCAIFCFLLTASASEQGARVPRTPNCGTWDLVFSPSPNGSPAFSSVAAVPGTVELWSVGNYVFNYSLTLAEHWDGTSWEVVASPNIPNANHYVYGVTAVAPNDVWAVGWYEPQGGGSRTLVLHWDGISWSIVPSPNPNTYNGLYAVAAVSASDVWAVGYYFTESTQRTLIEHWDGTSWSIVSSPNVGTSRNLLGAVNAVPNSQTAWAVGYYYRTTDGLPSTLIQRWDGTTWSVVASPDGSGSGSNLLFSVSSAGPDDAWAVGTYQVKNTVFLPLTEHWDGTTWQIVPSPPLSSSSTELNSVFSVSASDVWAVGDYFTDTSALLTLAQHWDGTSWQVFTTPNPAGFDVGARNSFTSVTSVQGIGIWAVGYYEVPFTSSQTLTAFYCPTGNPTPTPSPTATASPMVTATPTIAPSATPIATATPRHSPAPRPRPTPRPRP